MALLGATSLTGCNSIPQFIPGTADVGVSTSAASRTVFRMATSPVSWTKDTAAFNGTLRIVNGSTLSPGGSVNFPTVFSTSVPLSVTLDQNSIGLSVVGTSAFPSGSVQLPTILGGDTSTNPSTLSTSQIVSHFHTHSVATTGFIGPFTTANIAAQVAPVVTATGSAGQGGAHSHTIQAHLHPITTGTNSHTHTATSTQHSHTVTPTTQNFNINYVDIIVSIKN